MTFDLRLLWQGKTLLLLATLGGLAAGVAVLFLVPATYEAQARVLIEPQGVTPETEFRERVLPEFLPTQVETIRSPVTISRALANVQVTPPRGQDGETFDPVRHVMRSLKVTPILKANVVTVGYRSTNPEESLGVISSVVDAYRQHVAKLDQGNSKTNLQVVAAREQLLRKDLEKAQAEYSELRRSSPFLGRGREASTQALTELTQLASQLAEVRRQRANLEARLASLRGTGGLDSSALRPGHPVRQANYPTVAVTYKPEAAGDGIDDSRIAEVLRFADAEEVLVLQQIRERLSLAERRLERLDAVYGALHPDLIAAQAEVSEYQAMLRSRLREIVQAWKRELDVTISTEEALHQLYAAEQVEMKSAETYLIQEEHLQGNLAKMEQLHSATLAQLVAMQSTEKAVSEGRTSIEVRVLDGPVILDDVTWPKAKQLLPASACLGFVFGLGVVLLREFRLPTTQAKVAISPDTLTPAVVATEGSTTGMSARGNDSRAVP